MQRLDSLPFYVVTAAYRSFGRFMPFLCNCSLVICSPCEGAALDGRPLLGIINPLSLSTSFYSMNHRTSHSADVFRGRLRSAVSTVMSR
ncbi:hypothetical protein OE88DRAFT_375050 [Heliocybe sulcata]|uniref:Uncharacterized protein n=1 Tax=Heliocybe sulcata TaxID=5364 RepID=A0A5C3MXT8_9AGAM|nr:hypothetical protein OE88DRAFT_375050 [Heliocybe sulcata]